MSNQTRIVLWLIILALAFAAAATAWRLWSAIRDMPWAAG